MDLAKVAAVLRHRSGGESADLGLLLGRRFWGAILRPWLILVVPLLVLVGIVVGLLHPALAVLAGWWLKPLFDRIPLHVISRGFFGSTPSTKDTVVEVLRQWWSTGALADLTWRRFSPLRTMNAPVRVLEKSSGAEARRRLRSLYRGTSWGSGLALLLLTVGFKWAFYGSVFLLIVVLTPSELFADRLAAIDYLETADSWVLLVVLVAVTTAATTLVEPFFAAAGFGIYIQRRVEREGWDLELRFRRLVRRVENSLDGTTGILIAAGLAALMAGLFSGLTPVYAQPRAPILPEAEDALSEIDEQWREDNEQVFPVSELERPVDRTLIPVADAQGELDAMMEESPFAARTETRTVWEPKFSSEPEEVEPSRSLDPKILQALAQLVRIAIWIIFIAAAIFALWKGINYLRSRGSPEISGDRQARWREELLEQGESLELPEHDVADAARTMWASGQHREALVVLLLSSLVSFEERHQFHFPLGWTTGRCAREVAHIRPEGPVLVAVARAFARLAWAGRAVTDETFDEIARRFESTFETSDGGAP